MNEHIDTRRWSIIAVTLAVLLVLGVSALVADLASDQSVGLGMAVLGGLAIVLFGFAAAVPAARKYGSWPSRRLAGDAEQRVYAQDGLAFCLMLAVVWVVPGLLGYFALVPEDAVFPLAFAAFLLVGEATLHPGVKYLAWLPDETPIVVEGREVVTFHHRPRTAEVAKTASGEIEFRFTHD